MKNRKRMLALLLVLTLCFSLLPLPAFAEGPEDEEEQFEELLESEDLETPEEGDDGDGPNGDGEVCEHEPAGAVTENTVAPTCEEAGSHDEVVYCSLCGEELSRKTVEDPAPDHTPEAVEAVAPTCTEPGHTAGVKCAVCGAVLEGCEEIPALPEEDSEEDEPEEKRVRVSFSCTPREVEITVYAAVELEEESAKGETRGEEPEKKWTAALDENDEPVVIEPEDDGTYLLLPGTYLYDAACKDYENVEKEELTVEEPAEDKDKSEEEPSQTVEVELKKTEDAPKSTRSNAETLKSTPSNAEIQLDVPLYAQETHYTCADASARMCIAYYYSKGIVTGVSSSAPDETTLVSKYGSGSTKPIENGLSYYCGVGFGYSSRPSTREDFYNRIYNSIANGNPVVLNVQLTNSSFLGYTTDGGHYLVVIGVADLAGKAGLIVNDPYSKKSFSGQGFSGQRVTVESDDIFSVVKYMECEKNGLIINTTYTLTLNPSGGTCSTTSVSVEEGQSISSLPTPTLNGYDFDGWFTEPYGGTQISVGDTVSSDMTLYAHWSHGTRALVVFNPNGGSINGDTLTRQLNGIDIDRGINYFVLYKNDRKNTNSYGTEISVNANGRVVGARRYGDNISVLPSIPSGGFIVSGQAPGSGYDDSSSYFVSRIIDENYPYVGVDYEAGIVSAYKDNNAYLAGTKYLHYNEPYGELPVLTRTGYQFLGWYDPYNNKVEATDLCVYDVLHAEWAEEAQTYSGTCGDNLTWTLDAGGTLTISGTGAMDSYSSSWGITYAPWYNQRNRIQMVYLSDGVTTIGDQAFYKCENLTSVTIPENITYIGGTAFEYCSNLSSVTILSDQTSFGDFVFFNCSKLKTAGPIGSGADFQFCWTEAIPQNGFKGLNYLTSATLPKTVKSIGARAFCGCESLSSISIPSSVTSIGNNAFYNCPALTDVYYPGTESQWNAISIGDDNDPLLDAVIHFTFTVSYDANGGTGAPTAQEKIPGTDLTLSSETPRFENYAFLGWSTSRNAPAQYQPGDSYTIDASVTLYAVWFPAWLGLDHNYLLLKEGDTEPLSVTGPDASWNDKVSWTASADGGMPTDGNVDSVISVSETGLVTANGVGTAYAVAYIDETGEHPAVLASCRIDVVADEGREPVWNALYTVRLLDTKATVELYQLSYTRIGVIPDLIQNNVTADAANPTPINEIPKPADQGAAIQSARFADDAISRLFTLRVYDDRTLEIVPTKDAIGGVVAVNGSYKNAQILVEIDGEEHPAGMLTLTVKKTLPKLKVSAVKLNSFFADEIDLRDVISGGEIKMIDVANLPAWLTKNGTKLIYNGAPDAKNSMKLSAETELEGWAVKTPVTISVNAAKTAPKLTLKPTSVRLQPGCEDSVEISVAVTPTELAHIELEVVSITEGTTSYVNNKILLVEIDGQKVTVKEGATPQRDGLPHTYKVNISAGGEKPVVLTVKLLARDTATLTAKASGTIDLAVANSPVTFVPTLKNYSGNATYEVKEIVDANGSDMKKFFNINGLTLTAKPGLSAGKYTAKIKATLGEKSVDTTVSFTVKQSSKAPAASVTLKASGGIDVIRPGTAVTLTPTVKNFYGYTLSENDLVFYKIVGNSRTELGHVDDPDAEIPFTVRMENGAFVVTQSGPIDHLTEKYAVNVSIDGVPPMKSLVNLPVKMGAAKITQSVKAVTLLADDRYDRAAVKLTTVTELSEIDRVVLDSPKDKLKRDVLALTPLGNGEYAIGYSSYNTDEPLLPMPGFTGGTAKLNVFLKGNNSAKPNATLSVSVKLG